MADLQGFQKAAIQAGYSQEEVSKFMTSRKQREQAVEAVTGGQLDIKDVPQEQRIGVASEIKKRGLEIPTEETKKQKEARASIGGLIATLNDLKTDAQKVTLLSPLSDLLGGNIKDTQVRMFDQRKKFAGQFLARLVETGRLSDADRTFYQKEIANISPFGGTETKNRAIDRITFDAVRLSGFDPEEFGLRGAEIGGGGGLQRLFQPEITTGRNILGGGALLAQLGLARGAQAIGKPQAGAQIASADILGSQELARRASEQPRGLIGEQAGASGELILQALLAKGAGKVAGKVKEVGGKAFPRISGTLGRVLGPRPPQIPETALTRGLKTAAKGERIRNVAISKAQEAGKKVEGTNVFNIIKKQLKEAKSGLTDSQAKEVDGLIKRANKFYKGKKLSPSTAKSRWDFARKGFSSAGRKGETVQAEYHRAIRDGIRRELDKVAPGFEKGTKAIRRGLEEEKILKGVRVGRERQAIRQGLKETPSPVGEFGKRIGRRAVDVAGVYALLRLLGMGPTRKFD